VNIKYKNIMKLSIRTKLVCTFGFILIAMAITGWRGIAGMYDINKGLNKIKSHQFIPMQMTAKANIALLSWNRATLNHVLAENTKKMNEYEAIMIEQKIALTDALKTLADLSSLSEEGKELTQTLLEEFSQADPIRERVVKLSRAGKQEEARTLIRKELRPIIDRMGVHKTLFLHLQERQLNQTMKAVDVRFSKGFKRIAWIFGVTLLCSIFIIYFLSRGILRSVSEMVRGSRSVTDGDFKKAKLVITTRDEFEYLGETFNQMIDKLDHNFNELEKTGAQLKERMSQLDKSNKALDEFAYIVSHDLREPLRGISNLATFIEEDLSEHLGGKGASRLERMRHLTRRLETLIESILYYSRIDRTKSPFARVDLNYALAQAIDTIKLSLEQNKAQVSIPKNLPTVWCDSVRVGEVFLNLITNAMKYNDKPDKRIEIGFHSEKNPIVFHVSDNGIGIREKHKEKIFQIFKRLHGQDKYGGGTGAGLTIVKKIIENHKGRIWVESTLGKGTTIYFTLQGENNENR